MIYTGAAPNQQAIPAVDYLMKDVGVKRWVLEGTDYVYPRTTNKILEAYLKAKGVKPEDISINYTPFGYSDWQTRVAAIKKFGSAGKKTAVVSTINGDANVPFYKELGNQKVSAEDIPVVAFSVGEEELSGLDTKPLVGHLAAWNYFMSISTPANKAFIDQWHAYIKNPKRTTNDPMEAHYIGFNLWVKAVQKAGSTDVDKVLAALPGLETPNLTGGMAKLLPNHHITKPVYIGEVRADGQFDVVWKTTGHRAGRCLVGLPAGQQGHRSRLGDAQVRQLQHEDEGVLGTELQVTGSARSGGSAVGWCAARFAAPSLLLLAVRLRRAGVSPGRRLSRRAGGAARGQLRRQGSDRRASEPERPPKARAGARRASRRPPLLPQPGPEDLHRQVGGRQPLTTLELVDPLSLKDAGSRAATT